MKYFFILAIISLTACSSTKTISLSRGISNFSNDYIRKFQDIKPSSSCLSHYPVFMGASITSELGKIPGYQKVIWLGNKIENLHNKDNRSKKVVTENIKYGKSPSYMFLEDINPNFKNIYSMAIPVTLIKRHTGSGQVTALTTKNYRQCKKISSIFAIDLFYWDAIYNLCEDTKYNPISSIDSIIKFASTYEAPLFLGTVPNEDERLVHIDLLTSPWSAPNLSCLNQINKKLKDKCLVENNCYLVDLYELNEKLKAGFKLKHSSGFLLDYYGMRPDGIHLSEKGSEIILEKLKMKYLENPYLCDEKSL